MTPVIFNEADKIWKRLATEVNKDKLDFQLEIHKKLLQFFQVGDYYYYIFNVPAAKFDFMSREIFDVLGYDPSEVDVPFFLSKIHPEDQPYFLNFENKVTNFFSTLTNEQVMNYKFRYDYRVKKKNGEYIRILQQVATIQHDKEKGLARTLGVHTDITHIKADGIPVLSFIGLNGEPSYINVKAEEVYPTDNIKLSNREKQILRLLIEGKNTSQISEALFISEMTVKTHRRNILRKTNATSTVNLITNAIKIGWV